MISLYVANCTHVDAFDIWQRLMLPSFVVVDVIHRRIEHLGAPV